MKKTIILVVVILIMVAFTLAGCQNKAKVAQPAVPGQPTAVEGQKQEAVDVEKAATEIGQPVKPAAKGK